MNDQLLDIKNRQTRRKTAIDNPAVRDIDWLIAEIDSLRKEVERLESPVAAARVKAESELTDVKASLTYLAMKKRVEATELVLDRVRKRPEQWQLRADQARSGLAKVGASRLRQCADELTADLKGDGK